MKQKKLIMIVDDDQELLEELDEFLAGSGYRTVIFDNGTEVSRAARELQPDLILLDLKMEGKSGFVTATELTRVETTKYIPILGMTGYYKDRGSALLMNICGFQGFLIKPFDPQRLQSKICLLYTSDAADE